MTIAVRPFLLKPQRMNGLSERLLVSHYENNYGGALRRLNAIRARLAALDWGHIPVFEINGLKREELIAAGSVILHEIYFDSLGGDGDNPPTGLAQPSAGLAWTSDCGRGRWCVSLSSGSSKEHRSQYRGGCRIQCAIILRAHVELATNGTDAIILRLDVETAGTYQCSRSTASSAKS
jgi:hypothetical protein